MTEPEIRNSTETLETAPVKGLGLSKVVYALGMAARDTAVWVGGMTLVLTPVIFFGGEKNIGVLKWLAELPETISKVAKSKMAENSTWGKWGSAFIVAGTIASAVGYIAHIPGLLYGPRKIAKAEKIYRDQVNVNHILKEANQEQEDEITQLRAVVAEMKQRQNPLSFQDKYAAQQQGEPSVQV